MPEIERSALRRYGFAVVIVALCVIITTTVPLLNVRIPFALCYIAVLISTLFGGRGAGLLAVGLSALATPFLVLPRQISLAIGVDGAVILIVYVIIACAIVVLVDRLNQVEVSARVSNAQLTSTLMSIGEAMIATDNAGRVTLMNDLAQSMTGRPLSEVKGKELKDVFTIVNDKGSQVSEDPLENVRSAKSASGWATKAVLVAKQKEIPVDINGTAIKGKGERLSGFIFLFRDVSELKAADEKIRFQAHLLDVIEQAMIATDVSGRIIYWNQFAEKLYGWKASEVIGENVLDVTTSEKSREKAVEIMSLLGRGDSWSGDFMAQHKDGAVIPIRCVNSPVYDQDGKQIGIVGSSEDISPRIRRDSEKARLTLAIEEQRHRLDNIVASVPGVVWEAWGEPDAASQRIDFVSDYVETMLGYSVSEWLSTPNFWLQIVYEEDKERAAREAKANFNAGEGTSQFRWVGKDGRVVWVEAHSVVIYDDEGNPLGMRGVTMDITERVRADEIRSQLATIVETSTDVIIGKTLDGIITSWNKGAELLYGYSAEEAVGHPISIVIPTNRIDELNEILENIKNGRRVEHFETERITKDGRVVNLSVSVSPINNSNGQPIGASAIAHDITERKLIEAKQAELLALEKAARFQAELANRTKDEFLAVLSHELRTPLTAMLGWTWMLRYKSLDQETYARAVETIDRNVHVQAQLIDDLLDVSRIITGKLHLEMRETELGPLIESAIDTVRPVANKKGIDIEVELDPCASHVVCDSSRIRQVTWNLLSNAVKFTPNDGHVRVRSLYVDSHIEISVSDDGPGIATEILPYIFERFRQADSSTTRVYGGLGLGLTIVRDLVELHGGSVTVESNGAKPGSKFTVSLPLNNLPEDSMTSY